MSAQVVELRAHRVRAVRADLTRPSGACESCGAPASVVVAFDGAPFGEIFAVCASCADVAPTS